MFLDYANAWGEVLCESVEEAFVDGFHIGAYFALDTFACPENAYQSIMNGVF